MTRKDHKPLTTGFVPAIKRQIGSFKRLFSNQKPTSVHIEEDFEDIERILVSNTYNLVNKRPVDGKSDKNADNLDKIDVNELKETTKALKEATKVLKDYTNGLKEATHELKRLKKAQMEIKSPTKHQIEAKRAQTKTNLSKNVQNSKNVASKSSKEAKNSKNTPKRT